MNIQVKPVLNKILKERALTQTRLSELCGVPQSAISRFDNNRQHSDLHLFAISKALNLKIEELFEVIELN